MIMMGDRKKTVAAILGPETEKKVNEPADALHAVAEELIEAVKSGDAAGVAAALRAAWAECESDEPESSED